MINVYEELKGFKDRYTKNIIYELYIEHPELQHEIEIKIHSAIAKKTNDSEVSLLKKCNLLKSNEHLIKDGFDIEKLSVEEKDRFHTSIENLQFMSNYETPNLLFFGPPESGKEQLAMLICKEACKNGYKTHYIIYNDLLTTLRDHEFVKEENNEYNKLQNCELLIIDDFAGAKIPDAETAESLQWLLRQRTIKHMNVKGNRPRCTILLSQYPRCEWNNQIFNEYFKSDYINALVENHGIEMNINTKKTDTFSQSWY